MTIRDAARVKLDPIGHDSMMGTFLKKGSALVSTLVTGALCIGIVAAIGVTGPLALVAGAVIAEGMNRFGINDLIKGGIDKGMKALSEFFPPSPTGLILSGSTHVHINKSYAVPTLKSVVECSKLGHMPTMAAEGSISVHLDEELLHRKEDRIECGAFTMEGSPNVHVGGEAEARCDIRGSIMDWICDHGELIGSLILMAFSLRNAMKSCKSLLCLAGSTALGFVAGYVTQKGVSGLFDLVLGKPVNVLSGLKILDGEDDTDFSLPSAMPINWSRRYSSLDSNDSPFGPGWSMDYTIKLKINQGGQYPIIFNGFMGRELELAQVERGERHVYADEALAVSRTPGGQYIIDDRDGSYYSFVTNDGAISPADDVPQTLRLDHIEDRNGNRIRLRYDDQGRLTNLADSAGHLVECLPHHLFPGRIGSVRVCQFEPQAARQNWRVLAEYDYDETGRLASVRNALGEETRRFTWHKSGPGAGLMASHTLQSGLEGFYEWTDAPDHPRVSRHYLSDGQSWQIEWNENDLPVKIHLPNGGLCENEFDENGLLISQRDSLGFKENFTWNKKFETIDSYTDQAGDTWEYEYDERGNLIAEIDPNGAVTAYSLDRRGNLIAETEADGKISTYDYDKYDLLRRYTDCAGNVSTYEYDQNGLLVGETDALEQRSLTSRDVLGRPTGFKAADGATYAYSWNKQGLFEKSSDPEGGIYHLEYDPHGRLSSEINELGHRLQYAYDIRGNLTGLTNENGENYSFVYDAANREISQIGLDGRSTTYELDGLGLPVAVRRAAGSSDEILIQLERDLNGQLIRKVTAEYVTAYSYDPRGYLTAIKRCDADGRFVDSLSFQYDFNGNIVEEKSIEAALNGQELETVIKYEYDLKGRLIRTILPDGRSLVSDLCGCGYELRVSLAEQNGGPETLLAAFQRDALHREFSRIQGRQELNSQYDPLSRLKSRGNRRRPDLINKLGELVKIEKSFAYDLNGELVESRDSFSGQKNYKYDAAGRLTGTASAGKASEFRSRLTLLQPQARKAAEQLLAEERFAYDAASNLLGTGTDGPLTIRPVRTDDFGGIEVSSDDNTKFARHNRLSSFEGFSFKYDGLGRTVEKSHEESGRRWRFQYNSEDQLTAVQTVNGAQIGLLRFKYDALGRRVAKSDGATETRFTWSGMRLLQEAENENKITYVYEQGSYVPLARIDGWNEKYFAKENRLAPEGIKEIYYFHNHASGQPEEMSDRDGKIVWRGRYSAWGKLLYEEGELKQNLRMQGQYHDRETDLCYNTFRYYDSDIGRFTTEDPIGLNGGSNLYQYAPNPLMWIDPWGWERFPSWMKTTQGYQRQHLIPFSLRDHPFMQRGSTNINGAVNMMRLPVAEGISPNKDLGLHNNWTKEHAAYNKMVEAKLDKLEMKAKKENWDYRKTQQETSKLQKKLRDGFKKGKYTCA